MRGRVPARSAPTAHPNDNNGDVGAHLRVRPSSRVHPDDNTGKRCGHPSRVPTSLCRDIACYVSRLGLQLRFRFLRRSTLRLYRGRSIHPYNRDRPTHIRTSVET
jgi:hypothetical protein